MIIRYMQESDLPRVKELHSRLGFDYEFPDLKEFLPIPVIVDENNQVVMAVASMPTVELFFFIDKEWETPGMKMEAFKVMHEFVRRQLKEIGIVEGNAFIPPQLEKSFGRRLFKFGWKKGLGWPCFSRRTDV